MSSRTRNIDWVAVALVTAILAITFGCVAALIISELNTTHVVVEEHR